MQWTDLRGLRSSIGRGAARMTTTAARQRLPLLPLPRASVSLLTPRWGSGPYAGWVRPFSVGAQRNADDNPSWKQSKPRPPTLFEELFPDGDVSTPRRGNGRHHGGASTASQKDDGDGKVKVRFLTSTTNGKSDSAGYKQSVFEHKQKSSLAEHEAPAKIASILESQSPAISPHVGTAGDGRPSIFSELFSAPDPTPGAAAGGRSRAEQQLYEDRQVNHDDLQSWLDSLPKSDAAAADNNGNATTATSSSSLSSSSSTGMVDRSAMLILSNASPNLQESDFYRIGPQGHHLDGWSSSIRKVMQAYDYSTLEPMGRYFILFDSYAAAASYQMEAQRRHAAVRRSLLYPAAPLTSRSASNAEAGGSASSIFTLSPPSRAPLSLHIYKLDRATEARLGTFSIQGLLSMTPEPPPRANSHVILSVDGGTIDQRMLTYWLRRDARERNLGWPVQHMRPYFAPKVDSRAIAPGDSPDADESEWRYGDDDAPPPLVDSEGQQRGGGVPDENASSARFVLSFPDVHEARRFVRAWHKKEFVSSGSTVTLNTHVVW
ncbi:hypothetical protein CTA2_2946 [Colletotrichum tanaceti]|uniref:Uncharacterized protein n=1 Tax=Colletotrichum tanaceti TaxID=1306861 RepID=A0A4U6XDN0_9PEZI|nr:hypothetical protein CTA2_2946 [Colletotrichum tanaceti]TKW53319.1 hypothetical protein CTA1_8210 [Colletotrichum tanaceti]